MLLKGNGVTRKQVENQIGEGETSPAEPWEQAGIRREMLSLLHI